MNDDCLQPPHPTHWTVHVHGPDDLHFFGDSLQADDYADKVEATIEALRTRPEASPYDPVMSVHVIAPEGGAA